MPAARLVKTKKRCCKSKPRCRRCPVVMKRLVKEGHAESQGGRNYVVLAPNKALKRARRR